MILSAKPSRRRIIAEVAVVAASISLGLLLEPHLSDGLYRGLAFGLIFVATVFLGLFVVYFSRSPWRRTEATRSLMRLAVSGTMLLALVLSSFFLRGYPGYRVAAIMLYGWLAWSSLRMLVSLRAAQVRASRHPLAEGIIPTQRTHD